MTDAGPDGIGPDGTVRLRCQLRRSDSTQAQRSVQLLRWDAGMTGAVKQSLSTITRLPLSSDSGLVLPATNHRSPSICH